MRIVSLASGSAGNCYAVESDGAAFLIDCGVCLRDLVRRAAAARLDLSKVVAVAITHNHVDHVRGLAVFRKKFPGIPLFANMMTADAVAYATGVDLDAFTIFENGQEFDAGPFRAAAFSIPHDVPDPVGYTVRAGGKTYFHATDVGSPLDCVGVHLADADAATLESNHDPVMLARSARPESLKRRIRGPRGHLANCDAADLVRRFASPRLKSLFLAHLSSECNAPHLAEAEMRRALSDIGRGDVRLAVLSQTVPVETVLP